MDKYVTAANINSVMNSVRNRINELEEFVYKLEEFNHKVATRNSWRRKSGKTYGRWNK